MVYSSRRQTSALALLLTLIGLIVVATYVRHNLNAGSYLPASADKSLFSAGRAFEQLSHLTQEQVPHPVDSDANDVVRDRIVQRLTELGITSEIQDTKTCRDSIRGFARCTRVQNIVAHIPGELTGNGILLSAHYDSVPAGPGGSDAGAAVGSLLEIARLLSNQQKPKNPITLLFNEGEEFGLFGAKAFMEEHPLAKQIKLALNIEARGSKGQSVMFETGLDSAWLIDIYAKTSPAILTNSLFYEAYKFLPNDTDLTIFKQHGLQGLNFAHAEQLPHYHTPLDNLASLDKGSLQHHGDNVWGVLSVIKDMDLTEVETGNLVYTDILGNWFVSWPESWSLFLVAGLLLVLISFTLHFYKQHAFTFPGLFWGFLSQWGLLLVAGGAGWLIQSAAIQLADTPRPWFAHTELMRVSLWSLTALASLLLLKWLNQRTHTISSILGYAYSWLLLAILLSLSLTGVSYLFILPLLVVVICLWLVRQQILSARASAIIISLLSSIIFIPVVFMLEIMLGFSLSIAMAVVLAFSLVTLGPLFAVPANKVPLFKKPTLRFAHIAGILLVTGIGSLVWQANQHPYSSNSPQPLNVTYLQSENDSQITIGYASSLISQDIRSALPSLSLHQPFPWSSRFRFSSKVASHGITEAELPKAQATIIQTGENSRYQLQLTTNSNNLSDVAVYIPESWGLTTIEHDNDSFDYQDETARYNGYYQFHCRGRSCAELKLTLSLATTKDVTEPLLVTTVYQGLPSKLAHIAEKRAASSTPIQSGDQSIRLTKVHLN